MHFTLHLLVHSESIWTQELAFVDVVSDVKFPGEPNICILHSFGKDALFSTFQKRSSRHQETHNL